mmetsp:Transcript_94381/g.202606  ORF Transcript_94381/g.202606 Transcript_94381/m.202606 type:complete len:234 (-) Transcript_94381:26-727(-)
MMLVDLCPLVKAAQPGRRVGPFPYCRCRSAHLEAPPAVLHQRCEGLLGCQTPAKLILQALMATLEGLATTHLLGLVPLREQMLLPEALQARDPRIVNLLAHHPMEHVQLLVAAHRLATLPPPGDRTSSCGAVTAAAECRSILLQTTPPTDTVVAVGVELPETPSDAQRPQPLEAAMLHPAASQGGLPERPGLPGCMPGACSEGMAEVCPCLQAPLGPELAHPSRHHRAPGVER